MHTIFELATGSHNFTTKNSPHVGWIEMNPSNSPLKNYGGAIHQIDLSCISTCIDTSIHVTGIFEASVYAHRFELYLTKDEQRYEDGLTSYMPYLGTYQAAFRTHKVVLKAAHTGLDENTVHRHVFNNNQYPFLNVRYDDRFWWAVKTTNMCEDNRDVTVYYQIEALIHYS